jgi:hypothetical protein
MSAPSLWSAAFADTPYGSQDTFFLLQQPPFRAPWSPPRAGPIDPADDFAPANCVDAAELTLINVEPCALSFNEFADLDWRNMRRS